VLQNNCTALYCTVLYCTALFCSACCSPGSSTEPAENFQSKESRAKLDGLYECILCACCRCALWQGTGSQWLGCCTMRCGSMWTSAAQLSADASMKATVV
jgi:hypothetical protein